MRALVAAIGAVTLAPAGRGEGGDDWRYQRRRDALPVAEGLRLSHGLNDRTVHTTLYSAFGDAWTFAIRTNVAASAVLVSLVITAPAPRAGRGQIQARCPADLR